MCGRGELVRRVPHPVLGLEKAVQLVVADVDPEVAEQ